MFPGGAGKDQALTWNTTSVLQIDINETTRPWGLEVDRAELTVESVLKGPDDSLSGPVILPPSVPGLEGIVGPIQQLAAHFLGSGGFSQPPEGESRTSRSSGSPRAIPAVGTLQEHVGLSLLRLAGRGELRGRAATAGSRCGEEAQCPGAAGGRGTAALGAAGAPGGRLLPAPDWPPRRQDQ